jgi:hypothetical protein
MSSFHGFLGQQNGKKDTQSILDNEMHKKEFPGIEESSPIPSRDFRVRKQSFEIIKTHKDSGCLAVSTEKTQT